MTKVEKIEKIFYKFSEVDEVEGGNKIHESCFDSLAKALSSANLLRGEVDEFAIAHIIAGTKENEFGICR